MKTSRNIILRRLIVCLIFGWCVPTSFRSGTYFFNSFPNHASTIEFLPSSSSTTTTTTARHGHKIPNILIFTHYENLLLPSPTHSNVVDNNTSYTTSDKYSIPTQDGELQALRNNIQHTISLHPGATIRFLTDDDCLTSIKNVMPFLNLPSTSNALPRNDYVSADSSTSNNDTLIKTLMDFFIEEPIGSFKGDMCRGAALYETGGLYFDVDLGVRMNVFTGHGEVRMDTEHKDISFGRNSSSSFVLNPMTEFVTVKVPHNFRIQRGFFLAFLGTTARHPILKRYLELFWLHYAHQLPSPMHLANDSLYGVMFVAVRLR
jgi:hypothetical protein